MPGVARQRLSEAVGEWSRRAPSRIALAWRGSRTTYRELEQAAGIWARALRACGVRHGDRVAVIGPPLPTFIETFLGAASIGAVFQGLNPHYTGAELSYLLSDARPGVLIDLGVPHAASPAAAELGIRCLPGDLREAAARGRDITADELARAQAAVQPADPAAIVYTSGSTGRPKGALIPQHGLVATARVQGSRWFGGEPEPSILCNLPISHIGSLGNICCTTLVAGGRIVFQENFDAAGVLEVIAAERVSFWGAVPAMFQLTVATPAWREAELPAVRKILWSGGAASRSLIREVRGKCQALQCSYGSTETVGEITFSDDDADDETLSATIGRPDPHYEVRLARLGGESGAEAAGEILVRGDFTTPGYWQRPDATAAVIDADGWLHTGDIATDRGDGNLTLVGRTQEMFRSGGYNVYPREIEQALEAHPAVELAAVISAPDEVFGEVGHAYVIASPGTVTAAQLHAFAAGQLARHKLPKRIVIEPDLPLLPIGKIDKQALRSRR